ncbi:uncharacterized protein LOC130666759 [Microplitis mediator]|uniref:uncharacterized protein LOC130666759 n=1 Tax=Microplitis mediator TaxID=375433 RepID=UPI00255379DC|nr:uncharacterized protein LOC130666759 [Microplitis mediator]
MASKTVQQGQIENRRKSAKIKSLNEQLTLGQITPMQFLEFVTELIQFRRGNIDESRNVQTDNAEAKIVDGAGKNVNIIGNDDVNEKDDVVEKDEETRWEGESETEGSEEEDEVFDEEEMDDVSVDENTNLTIKEDILRKVKIGTL